MNEDPTILIRDLIDAKVDASLIARVSVLAARVAELDRRRAADADRQRRRRSDRTGNPERHVSHVTSRDSSDVTPRAYTSPQESSKTKRSSRSACVLPDDWQPDREFARSKGWPEAQIDSEAARFQDHAKAKGRTARDWQAAWRNWVTSPYQNTQPKGSMNGQGHRTLATAADDLIARTEEFEQQERNRTFNEPH